MIKMTPTKANLMKSKSMLDFSLKGYDLLDQKRNVLIKEVMSLVSYSEEIQNAIEEKFKSAYTSLQYANVIIGNVIINDLAESVPLDENYNILLHSVMGVEIPKVKYDKKDIKPSYGLFRSNVSFDSAFNEFNDIKYLIYELAEVETTVYKLAMEIKKTQKRANGLEKIQIPKYKYFVKTIEESLEEKEREDFFRLKRVKSKKDK